MAQLNRNPVSVRRLDAYRVALELLEYVETLLPRIRSKAPAQADQLDRACPSIPQNLGEGMRRTGRDRAHLLTISLGSAEEVRVTIDVVRIKKIIEIDEARVADELADRVCAMVYRMRERLA